MIQLRRTWQVDKGIDEVWETLSGDFNNVYEWASGVLESRAGTVQEGADRVCTLPSGIIHEQIMQNDPGTHTLQYRVTKGFPFFVKDGHNTWTLSGLPGGRTEVSMHFVAKTIPVIGSIMGIPMKAQFDKLFDQVVVDFTSWVNTRSQSEAKKAAAKHALTRTA